MLHQSGNYRTAWHGKYFFSVGQSECEPEQNCHKTVRKLSDTVPNPWPNTKLTSIANNPLQHSRLLPLHFVALAGHGGQKRGIARRRRGVFCIHSAADSEIKVLKKRENSLPGTLRKECGSKRAAVVAALRHAVDRRKTSGLLISSCFCLLFSLGEEKMVTRSWTLVRRTQYPAQWGKVDS